MEIMAEADRIKWDSRYLENPGALAPSPLLTRFAPLATVGKALDLACGNGRNSIYLAERGFFVDAVDISTVATNRLAGKHPNINVICTDLDTWSVPQNRYELIVNIRFLDRRLFPMIRNGLKPGGVLIFESFLDGESVQDLRTGIGSEKNLHLHHRIGKRMQRTPDVLRPGNDPPKRLTRIFLKEIGFEGFRQGRQLDLDAPVLPEFGFLRQPGHRRPAGGLGYSIVPRSIRVPGKRSRTGRASVSEALERRSGTGASR